MGLDSLIGTYCWHLFYNLETVSLCLKFWRFQNKVKLFINVQKRTNKFYISSVGQNVGNHVNFPQHYFMVSAGWSIFDVLDPMGEHPNSVNKKLTFHILLSSAFHSESYLCNQQLSLQERRCRWINENELSIGPPQQFIASKLKSPVGLAC